MSFRKWCLFATVQIMISHFKDAQVETNQPIVFESDQVNFEISNNSIGKWDIKVVNSSVVSVSNQIPDPLDDRTHLVFR